MGVMICSRGDCTNIMCDTYVDSIGYICHECQEEFKEYIDINNIDIAIENDITHHLSNFMETDKTLLNKSNRTKIERFFRNNTK